MEKQLNNNPLPDYHMHTFLCKHAIGGADDYRRAAHQKGIPEICFADHGPNPDGYDPDIRMDMARFPEYREMVTAQQGKGSPNNPPIDQG